MDSPTIFLVSCGEYSNYCVCGLFSTRERAEAYRKHLGSDNEIEEYTLDALALEIQ